MQGPALSFSFFILLVADDATDAEEARTERQRVGHEQDRRFLAERNQRVDRTAPVVVYCGSGYRASIPAGILRRQGFGQVYNVPGSISAWLAAGYPLLEPDEENGEEDQEKK